MNNQVSTQLRNPLTFSFPTIYHGIGVMVAINCKEARRYSVLIDDQYFGKVELESNFHNWIVSEGELNDPDLVKEIGERIEAKFN